MSWSLIKTGTKEPIAGSMKMMDNTLLFSQTFLILKTMYSIIVAAIKPREMKFVVKIELHTMCPIKNGCRNNILLSISKNLPSFSSCYFSYSSSLFYYYSYPFFYSSSPSNFFSFSWSSSSNLYIKLSLVSFAFV